MTTVGDVLRWKGHRLCTAGEQDSLVELAESMADEEVGSLVIMGSGAVTGIVTRRDIVDALSVSHATLTETRAVDIMTTPVHCVESRTTLANALATMRAIGIRHVVVLSQGATSGMVSMFDVLEYWACRLYGLGLDLEARESGCIDVSSV